jgi:hemoglobin
MPNTPGADVDIYKFLGGEAGLNTLVNRFYVLMDTLPEAAVIRAMHPPELKGSGDKLYAFLVERFGGPPLYSTEHGHPRLRRRHLPFAIDEAAVDAWMICMSQALHEQYPAGAERDGVEEFLGTVALKMRNR